jgi:hypothetical protein
MNFIFAKLFEQYQKKNESPVFSITLYISIVYFFLLSTFLLPISEVLKLKYFGEEVKNKGTLMFIIFSALAFITYLVYYKYIKKKTIYKLINKYREKKINKFMLYTIVMFMPVFFLFIGATITILLKGGKIVNWQIEGIIQ